MQIMLYLYCICCKYMKTVFIGNFAKPFCLDFGGWRRVDKVYIQDFLGENLMKDIVPMI